MEGSLRKRLGRVVAALAEAGQVVVVALQVVDALADLEQIVRRVHGDAGHRRVLRRERVQRLGEGGELADVQAVGDGVHVLEDHRQLALALPGQRVGYRGGPSTLPTTSAAGV